MIFSDFISILLVAIALAMDSFTVAISGGATLKKVVWQDALKAAFYFGFFQGLMTFLGWQGGLLFSDFMNQYAPWVASGLLLLIGGKMIYEALKKDEKDVFSFTHKILFTLAVATSIDAFGVGLGYSLLGKPVIIYSFIIALTAFLFSGIGVYLGKFLKKILDNKAEILGGVILVLMAVSIMLKNLK